MENLHDYPVLLIAFIWSQLSMRNIRQAQIIFNQTEHAFPDELASDVSSIRAQLSMFENNPQKTRRLTEYALTCLRDEDVIMQGLMRQNLALVDFFNKR